MGVVPTVIFTPSSGPPLYILTLNKFEWTLYSDPKIQECIPFEFLVNPNMWHMKVPLVVYVMVEMHELEIALQKFRFT
ncbi:hypothetical protein J1N35_029257 [Gossypium stocksii]|uniref:Uncharacterized protein n=1 Tax=Gossypium stocksii TaxID=47602 RepID=A0A9D3ZTD9_9ROSI|nr:hypothetical protein J1N35_029257 [Gossypium stocksii]